MKRLALALPAEHAPFTRDAGTYRPLDRESRAWVSAPAIAEMVAKAIIVVLFSSMAFRLAKDWLVTGHLTGMLLLASESLVVALTLMRRSAGTVDRSWTARLLTGFSTFSPNLVTPLAVGALAPDLVTTAISGAGLMIVVLGKLSLGRSFGLAPANRGIVSTGLYKFVRHPIYVGYLITHASFALANPAGWNIGVLVAADLALMLRAVREERTLGLDQGYRAYMQQVRWRILPRVF
jgi:protein-S-isoprenylcysteine O-methyltransferase Ste14